MCSQRRARAGFTLVELLIVILVLGVLLAIAIPTLLRAQDSAKDGKAKVALNSTYKAAKTVSASHESRFTYSGYSLGDLASDIEASKPGATVVQGSATSNSPAGTVYLATPAAPHDGDQDLLLTTTSGSGKVCSLEVQNGRLASLSCADGESGPGLSIIVPQQHIVAGWQHTCALFTGSKGRCWGVNMNGRLGTGAADNSYLPVAVADISSPVSIVTGAGNHTCAVMSDTTIKCWGGNGAGELGDQVHNHQSGLCYYGGDCSPTPVTVKAADGSTLTGAVQVAVGGSSTCALLSSGKILCWGADWNGQLGDGYGSHNETGCAGSADCSFTAVEVSGITNAAALSMGNSRHFCAVLDDGSVKCWGMNDSGQLGAGSAGAASHEPVSVSGLSSAVAVVAGDSHTCALLSNGTAWCWGYGGDGELGNGVSADSLTPVQVKNAAGSAALTGVTALSSLAYHTCALLSDKTVQCWGGNWSGQLGDGTTTDSNLPVSISSLSGVAEISAGNNHSCALLESGNMQCWGLNDWGQLGDGTTDNSPTPVDVKDAKQLSVSHAGPGATDLRGNVAYLTDTSVTITATPDGGSSIDAWGGDCAATPNTSDTCTLTMDADKSVSVTFAGP